jgi:hypothetical protein
MVTLAGPAPLEVDPDGVAGLELAAALDDFVELDDVLEDSLSFEHAATPATAIVAAPKAIKNSRFTDFSFV